MKAPPRNHCNKINQRRMHRQSIKMWSDVRHSRKYCKISNIHTDCNVFVFVFAFAPNAFETFQRYVIQLAAGQALHPKLVCEAVSTESYVEKKKDL